MVVITQMISVNKTTTYLGEFAICEELEEGTLADDTVANQDQAKLVVENGIDHRLFSFTFLLISRPTARIFTIFHWHTVWATALA